MSKNYYVRLGSHPLDMAMSSNGDGAVKIETNDGFSFNGTVSELVSRLELKPQAVDSLGSFNLLVQARKENERLRGNAYRYDQELAALRCALEDLVRDSRKRTQ